MDSGEVKQNKHVNEMIKQASPVIGLNGLMSAFNMLSTVIIVRWFGLQTYADYVVDLALLSLLSLVLEIVPSSYAVFRVQERPELISGLAVFSVISGVAIALLSMVFAGAGYFQRYSIYIFLYGFLLAVRRYFDIRLQSKGRLKEYFQIEATGSFLRVFMVGIFAIIGSNSRDVVWMSLAFSTMLAQGIWLLLNPDEWQLFFKGVRLSSIRIVYSERKSYIPYYLGVTLKRIRDNLLPILTNYYFVSKETLGIFLLSYRGLVFTLGQIRVIEGLLNHRETLKQIMSMPFLNRLVVATIGQIVSICVCLMLALFSGIKVLPLGNAVSLSLIVWIYVFSVLARAEAYSKYKIMSINFSLAIYVVSAIVLTFLIKQITMNSSVSFIGVLILSEMASLYVLLSLLKKGA